ncbi:MAG TPA: efflux RND transporter periplasmic adaptor subunit [Candidatus Gastranaerophilaceae bacterium]|nr:efflux RND transporter periplasmic adaptor subunit [Candidatus Gastranaerophilaceae bacterium]HPT41609.1 efflux RND transporter periplasmic adaptor subunit [Candidatus Gastranaerophilaceae bacterium]
MMKKIIILVFLISLSGLIFYSISSKKVDKDFLTLYGNVEIRQVDLGFRVEGKIAKMLVEEGDAVKKGQLLALLEDENYKATYEKSLADIELYRALSTNAASKYERNIPLCKDSTTSKQECDDLLNSKNSTKASFEAATAASKGAKKNFDDTRIYAPDDGIIMTRIQEPGASVTPSQPIYTMAKNKPVWVRAYIPEPNLANVKYGMEAKVLTDTKNPQTGKQREYKGQVGYISPVAEFTPKTVQTTDLRTDLVYRIRVYIYDLDEYLRQGMPVTVKIKLNS